MVDLEPSLHRCHIFIVLAHFFDGEVASDNYPLGANKDLRPLHASFEGVPVSPHLEMMDTDLLGSKLLDDNGLLSYIAIPPDVIAFDEGLRPLGTDVRGLARTRVTVMPLVLERAVHDDGFFLLYLYEVE